MPRFFLVSLIIITALFFSIVSFADDNLSATDRMKSCDPHIALTAAKEILSDPETLKEPLEMFSPALVLYQKGERNEAVFWFYAAQLRSRYQLAFQKGDRVQLLSIMLMTTGPPINNHAFQDVPSFVRTLDRVLDWDKKTANPFRTTPRSESIDKQIKQVYAELQDLRDKLVAEQSALEASARKAAPGIERAYSLKDNPLCREGQPDPAYAAREIKIEWSQVIDFVKNNKEVIQEVGGIKSIYPRSSTKRPTEVMPFRYGVSVNGVGGESIYPIIGVERSKGHSEFTLECISHLSSGYREAFKDVCSQ